MNKAQLLPCPFCGHDTPEFERLGTPRQSCIVICGDCGCRHESSDEGERNGTSWNDRVSAKPPSASGERETAEAFAFASTNEPSGLLRHWWRKGYDAGRAAPSPGIDAAEQKPVAKLLRWGEPGSSAESISISAIGPLPPDGTLLYAAAPAAAASAKPVGWIRWDASKTTWHMAPTPTDNEPGWEPMSGISPHPPSRHCMCADCKPSFEPDHGWWMAEAERLVDAYVKSVVQGGPTYADCIRRVTLLDHLRAHPGQGGANG